MKQTVEKLNEELLQTKGGNELNSLLEKVNELIKTQPEHIGLLQLRAEIYKKLQKFGLAINDYRAILSIDKNQKQAEIQIEQLLMILKYQNTDIFENPNTNFDPWLD